MIHVEPPDITESDMFAKAAAEAREASRNYWRKGGPADRKYPQQPMPWWPDTPHAGDDDLREQRRRRRQAPK